VPIAGDNRPFDPTPFLRFPRVLLFGANHFAQKLPAGGAWIAWDKACNGGPADGFSDCEFAWTTERTARNVIRVQWKGVCTANIGERNGERLHPTQKPIALMRRCVDIVDADLILDPFAGSGTTMVAAHRTGRQSIGIEIEPKYCEIAKQRMLRELAQPFLPGMEPHAEARQSELFESAP
jgi:hypothetical protein